MYLFHCESVPSRALYPQHPVSSTFLVDAAFAEAWRALLAHFAHDKDWSYRLVHVSTLPALETWGLHDGETLRDIGRALGGIVLDDVGQLERV